MLAVLAISFEAHVRSGVWRKRAACLGLHPNDFYPIESADTAYDLVRPVCEVCPVSLECDQYAFMINEQNGMWAGRTEPERKRARKKWVKVFIAAKTLPPVIERRSAFGVGEERGASRDVSSSVRIQVALHLLKPFATNPTIPLMGVDDPSSFVAHLSDADPIPEVIKVIDRLFTDGLLDNQVQNDQVVLTTLGARFLQSHDVKVANMTTRRPTPKSRKSTPITSAAAQVKPTQPKSTQPSQPIPPRGTVMSDYLLEFLAKQPEGRFKDEGGRAYEAIARLLHRTKGSISQHAGELRRAGLLETDGARGKGTFEVWITAKGSQEIGEEPPTGSPPPAEQPASGAPAADSTTPAESASDVDISDLTELLNKRFVSLLNPGAIGIEGLSTWYESLGEQLETQYLEIVTVLVGRLQEAIDQRMEANDALVREAQAETARVKNQLRVLLDLEDETDTTGE